MQEENQALLARRESSRETSSPFFTIVIPTRNRSGLARKSVHHALSQNYRDFELILLDNSDTRELSTKEFDDVRCKVVPSSKVLSMRDNWERAIDVSSGKYVMVLSDKDMLVPGALARLAEAAESVNADMLTFRKASFGTDEGFVSCIQRCSGRLTEESAAPVLAAWFNDVQHFHDAPMLYNSAVRRTVLVDLRNEGGRFFAGTSPDIGSGATLLAKLKKFHLVDRPLVVSWYGTWSIGVAASRGAQGAAAAFIAEHKADPIREAGLVTGIPGSVAETLLDCKRLHPRHFASLKLRWSGYVSSVLWDLLRRSRKGIDISSDEQFLFGSPIKRYSRLDSALGFLRFRWERADLPRRLKTRMVKAIGSFVSASNGDNRKVKPLESADSLETTVSEYFMILPYRKTTFRDVPYFNLPPTAVLDDVIAIADRINLRLDQVERTSKEI
jgi:glycosyltransferase involved in cell wall biosynthesis